MTLAFLAFFGYDLSLNVVAAILTITGYSVNDTIVVFDRVRENFRSMRRDSLEQVVNTSVNQTLARTVITAGTTLLSVVALYLFGGEVLEGFAFTMIVGIISGTYSTVFIAAAIAILLSRQKDAARVPATAAEPADGGPQEGQQPQEPRVVGARPHPLGYFEAISSGRVQGLTEFLPVSSSAHLILARALLGLGRRAARDGVRRGVPRRDAAGRRGLLPVGSGAMARAVPGLFRRPLWPADEAAAAAAARRPGHAAGGARRAAGRGQPRGSPADAAGGGRVAARRSAVAVPGGGAGRARAPATSGASRRAKRS